MRLCRFQDQSGYMDIDECFGKQPSNNHDFEGLKVGLCITNFQGKPLMHCNYCSSKAREGSYFLEKHGSPPLKKITVPRIH